MTCLDDDTVLGLVEGRLGPGALATADDHLDECPSCRDLLAQVARTRAPSRRFERGHTIGRFVIGDLIGSGAMGHVYSAWEPELDRRVAIKVLQDGPREALIREAQAMARLSHPNVVTIYEVGTSPDGVHVAMELVDGETLRAWSKRARIWRERLAIVIEIARGLAAVHAAGVVHRDVKPDNVIVGSDGRARLGDFGLARASDPLPATQIDALGTTVAGTPAYLAPEVLRGGAADGASDQFAFGITAYEVFAGQRPFIGQTWAALVKDIDTRAPATLAVPGWLDRAIRRCLARDPAQRFGSMAAVVEHLSTRLGRRRPIAWAAGIAAAAVIASGATWLALGWPTVEAASCELGSREIAAEWSTEARAALDGTAPPFNSADGPGHVGVVAAHRAGPEALAALDTWTQRWADERDATCRATDVPARLAARDRCLEQRRAELGALLDRLRAGAPADRVVDALAALPSPTECRAAQPDAADPLPLDADRAGLARQVAADLPTLRAAVALGDARAVLDRTTKLVATARASGHAPTLADALLVEVDVARGSGQRELALAAAREAVVVAERGHDDEAAARAWIARTSAESDVRDLAAAEDFGELAAAAVDRAGAPPHLVATVLRLRGTIAYNRGQLDAARTLLADARARFGSVDGERSVEIADVDSLLGSVARAAGDLALAEQLQRAALALDRVLHGPTHPTVARDLHNVAGVLRLRGELDAALATYRQALAIEVMAFGERSAEAGLTHNSLGLVQMARRDWPGARAELELARDLLTAAEHGDRAFAEHNLGLVAAATGDHRAALDHYARADEIYRATIGDDAPSPMRLALDRARSERALGHDAVARALATRARLAATRAGVAWIVSDANALLADAPAPIAPSAPIASAPIRRPTHTVPTAPVEVVARPPEPPAAVEPTLVAVPPVTPPPDAPPQPQPRRDVGAYGASQPR